MGRGALRSEPKLISMENIMEVFIMIVASFIGGLFVLTVYSIGIAHGLKSAERSSVALSMLSHSEGFREGLEATHRITLQQSELMMKHKKVAAEVARKTMGLNSLDDILKDIDKDGGKK